MNRWVACTLPLMVACGLSEDRYQEKYVDKYCDQFNDCDPEADCNYDSFPDLYKNCDYDSKAARRCLNEEWTCNTEFDPIVFPEHAGICDSVYVCGGDVGDTAAN